MSVSLKPLFLLGLLGCCASGPAEEPWPGAGPLGRDVPAFKPPAEGEARGREGELPKEPEGELSLGQAVALTLLQSPDLAAYGWEVRAREARIVQAGLLPNPSADVSVENLGTRRDDVTGGLQTTIQLGQLVELGGKRSARLRVASLERDVAGWDYELRRMDLLSRVSLRFIEVLSLQRRVSLAEETLRLAGRSREAVVEKVKAGHASPVEETRAGVAFHGARITLERLQRELEAARKTLSATWGNVTPRFKSASGDLDAVAPVPSFGQLVGLLSKSPELAHWAAETALRRAAVELAEARAVPDLTLGAGYRRYSPSGDDVDTFLVGFSIPLPVFDRNQGGIREARTQVARSEEERRAAELRLGTALAESYRVLAGAHAELAALRETVLPGAQSAFEAVSEGYRLGRFGILDVFDSQRTFSEARLQALRAATDYHKAVVDVERLIGERLDSVNAGSNGDSK